MENPNQNQPQDKDEFIVLPPQPQPPVGGGPAQPSRFWKIFPVVLAVFMLIFGFFGGMLYANLSGNDRAKAIEWMVKTIEENSYYYDKNLNDEKRDALFGAMGNYGLDLLIGSDDHYAEFLTPAELQEVLNEMNGTGAGLAVEYWNDYQDARDKDGNLLYDDAGNVMQTPVAVAEPDGYQYIMTRNVFLSQVYECTPAEEQASQYTAYKQLRRFDRFVALETNGVWKEYWNEHYGDFLTAMSAIPAGQPYKLKVLRVSDRGDGTDDYPRTADGDFDLSQAVEVTVENVEEFTPTYVDSYDSASPEMAGTDLPADTMYVDFKSFMGKAADQFASVMNQFKAQGKKNLILDLRYDGGGLLDILGKLGNYLVTDENNSSGVVLGYQKYRNRKVVYKTSKNLYKDMGFDQIVVLVNGNTASASEALLGAMLHYGTADAVIGNKTYGKGIMQQFFLYKQNKVSFALKLTVAQLFLPDDASSIHTMGFGGEQSAFIPDGVTYREVEETPAQGHYAADAQFMAAVDFLRENA